MDSWPWIYDLFQCLTPQPPLPPSPWGGYIIPSTLHPTSCLRLWWDESKRKTQERHWKSPNPAGLHSVSYLFLPSHTTSLLCLVTATTLFQDNRPAPSMKTAGRLLWIDDCEGGACNCLPRDQEEKKENIREKWHESTEAVWSGFTVRRRRMLMKKKEVFMEGDQRSTRRAEHCADKHPICGTWQLSTVQCLILVHISYFCLQS